MATSNSAQGSITVKRLRTGGSLFITLQLNDKPLFQNVSPDNGAVAPDWKTAGNQPVITPVVTSSLGNSVTLGTHAWYYEGNILVFTGSSSSGFTTDSSGKFAMNPTTGALKIIDNLASAANTASDILKYTGVANVGGVEYPIEKEIEVIIQNMGANAHTGYVMASNTQLNSEASESTLTTRLFSGSGDVFNYYVRWYKDGEEWAANAGKKTITVTSADVNGSQLFIAEFFGIASGSPKGNVLARHGINIVDTKDIYRILLTITSSNKDVDEGKSVTLSASVFNTTTNAKVDLPSDAAWALTVMDGATWTEIRSVNSSTIEISTDDTDVKATDSSPAKIRDVEVVAEVTWS